MERVDVKTSRPYSVYIGRDILKNAGEMMKALGKSGVVALVMDDTVAGLYGGVVAQSLFAAGFRVAAFRFAPGEQSKSMETLKTLLEFLADESLDRNDSVLALGGGVTGDLAGFASSVYRRGISYIGFPTTLLSAVDSSVGGKTAVNLAAGKNLAGTFFSPDMVVCDCDTFHTLPEWELSSGAAECIKYGVLKNPALLERLTNEGLSAHFCDIVKSCVQQKADVVESDERDEGPRQLLNLGHTFGHAIEYLSGYTIRHGEGVGEGMLMIARAAEKLGLCVPGVSRAIERALIACKLPTACPYPPEALAEAALTDKKRRGGEITLVMPRDIGDCFLHPVRAGDLTSLARLAMEEPV
ncbi:3-dehydroquinate synthase [Christensenellaceae bacterium OttesenSCG-928-M15]|nr:3-dehydroquinate synthase [Christensenellaceae bacterium OttesenSCG-928-M15]